MSAAAMFGGIALLGLDDAMVRYVAILSGRRDHRGLWGTLQLGLGVSTAVALLMGTCLFIAAGPVAGGLFHEPRLAPMLRLFAVIVPFLTMSNVLLGTARGFHRMDYGAVAQNVVQTLVRAALLGGLALFGRLDLLAAGVVFGISDVAATVTLIVLLNRHFPLRGMLRPDARRPAREVFRFAFPLWLSGLLRQFRRNIQNVMLGALSGVSNVGIFAVANRANLVGHVSLQSTLIAVKPSLAQLHARRDRDGLARLYTTATRWTFTLNVPFFLIIVLFPEPILRLFGESFIAGTSALIVFACAELVNAGTGICGSMIDMTGHTRVKLANSIAWTILLIGGGAVLIPAWGVLGAATATFIAIAAVNLASVVEMWVLERVLPFDRTFLKPLVAGLGALAFGVGLRAWAPVGEGLWPLFTQAAIVGAVYVGLILLFGLAPDDRLVIDRVLNRVGLAPGRRHPRRMPSREEAVPTVPVTARATGARSGPRLASPARRPVYIGGLDRSGKTTMAGFLTSHPNIAIPAVGSNMWTYFFGRFGDLAKPENLDRCLRAMLGYSHVRCLDPEPERIRREFSQGLPTYARLFSLFLIHYAEARGKSRWGAQTGLIERYADHVFRAEPDAKVIHMVRDPRDRYEASLALWPEGMGRAGAATARWRYSIRLGERNLHTYPQSYMLVRYEDLVLRTEETLRRVCSFLGEAFVPDMLGMPDAPERRRRLLTRAGPEADGALLSPDFIGRFRGRVPPNELAFLQLHLGRLMRAHQYEPELLNLSPGEWTRFALVDWPGHAARMLAWRVVEAVHQRYPGWLGPQPDARTLERPQSGAIR